MAAGDLILVGGDLVMLDDEAAIEGTGGADCICECGVKCREVFDCSDDSSLGFIQSDAGLDFGKIYKADDVCMYFGEEVVCPPEVTPMDPAGWEAFDDCFICKGLPCECPDGLPDVFVLSTTRLTYTFPDPVGELYDCTFIIALTRYPGTCSWISDPTSQGPCAGPAPYPCEDPQFFPIITLTLAGGSGGPDGYEPCYWIMRVDTCAPAVGDDTTKHRAIKFGLSPYGDYPFGNPTSGGAQWQYIPGSITVS
jgi:hypothetical protein